MRIGMVEPGRAEGRSGATVENARRRDDRSSLMDGWNRASPVAPILVDALRPAPINNDIVTRVAR